jgi:hypothetical protein
MEILRILAVWFDWIDEMQAELFFFWFLYLPFIGMMLMLLAKHQGRRS